MSLPTTNTVQRNNFMTTKRAIVDPNEEQQQVMSGQINNNAREEMQFRASNNQDNNNEEAIMFLAEQVEMNNNFYQAIQIELVQPSQFELQQIQKHNQIQADLELLQYIEPPIHIQQRTQTWGESKLQMFNAYSISIDALKDYNKYLKPFGLEIQLYTKQNQQELPLTHSVKCTEITSIMYQFTNENLLRELEELLQLCCQSYHKVDNNITIYLNQDWQFVNSESIYRGGWGFNKFQGFGQSLSISKNQASAHFGFYWQGKLQAFGIDLCTSQWNYELQQDKCHEFYGQQIKINEYKEGFEKYRVDVKIVDNNTYQKIEGCKCLRFLKITYDYALIANQYHRYKLKSVEIENE